MAPPRPTEELRDPEKPSIDYRMGGYDHTDDPTADAKRQADVKREAARKEQLKRAQADYQTLDFLESLTFIVIVTIFVIVDINLSMTRDTSKPAKSFQAFVTFFFLTELVLRVILHNEVHDDLKVFLSRPLTMVDAFCVLTDLFLLYNLEAMDPEQRADPKARAINMLRLCRIAAAADWFKVISDLRTSALCVFCCGKAVADISEEDDAHEEQINMREEYAQRGIFMETETIEAVALTDDSLPAASSSKSVNDGGSGIGEKGDGSEGQRIGASQSIHQKMIYEARARKAAEAKEVWMSAVVVRINEDETYHVKYDVTGEHWYSCPPGKVRRDLRLPSAVKELGGDHDGYDLSGNEPKHWQYKCLRFQEGIPATFFVCLIVLAEIIFVNKMEDGDPNKIAASTVISVFFFLEICLRFYNYHFTYKEWLSFFFDPLRILDFTLVLIDVMLFVLQFFADVDDARAVKLARIGRLARNAKWLKTLRSARSLRLLKGFMTCEMPTTSHALYDTLEHGAGWSATIIVVAVMQFVVAAPLSLLGERPLTYFNVALGAFFALEMVLRLALHCRLEESLFAFPLGGGRRQHSHPLNNLVDVATTAGAAYFVITRLMDEQPTGVVVNRILLFRAFRITRGFKWAVLVGIIRSNPTMRAAIDSRCPSFLARCCCPPTATELANRAEAEAREMEEQRELSESIKRLSEPRDGSLPPILKPGICDFTGVRGVRYGDGCIYQGNWEDGLEEGVGQTTFPTGDKYKGNFRRGLKQGRGLYLFKNGDEFRGSFMTNQKHGPGKYTWKDGDTYEATFEHGKEDGKAVFESTDGRVVFYKFNRGKEMPIDENDKDFQMTRVGDDEKEIFNSKLTQAQRISERRRQKKREEEQEKSGVAAYPLDFKDILIGSGSSLASISSATI